MKMRTLLIALLLCSIPVGCEKIETEEKESEPPIDYLAYTYEEVSINTMVRIYKDNPLKAENDYLNKYVTFSGYESYPEGGTGFLLHEAVDDGSVYCELDSSLPSVDATYSGITVWGQITSVDDVGCNYTIHVLHYEIEEPLPPEDRTYIECTSNELIDLYSDDSDEARERFYRNYVSVSGPILEISTDWVRIGTRTGDGYTFSYGWVECTYTSEDQKQKMLEYAPGDTIVVKGRVINMHQSIGSSFYDVDIDEIV